jgi:hypothetical protein
MDRIHRLVIGSAISQGAKSAGSLALWERVGVRACMNRPIRRHRTRNPAVEARQPTPAGMGT